MWPIGLLLWSVAVPSESFSVSGTGVSAATEPPRQCVSRALDNARSRAMERAPREIATTFLDTQSIHDQRESQFVHSYTTTLQHALFRTERIEEKPLVVDAHGNVRCEVVLTGAFLDVGAPDPTFTIRDFTASQPSYFVGQDAQISLTLSDRAYVYVLNVDADNNVTLLFPNAATPSDGHLIAAKKPWRFPSAGTKLTAALAPGQTESVEMLQVIAVRDQGRLFADASAQDVGPYKVMSVGDMNAVIARLATLKRTQWTTATAAYTIRAKN